MYEQRQVRRPGHEDRPSGRQGPTWRRIASGGRYELLFLGMGARPVGMSEPEANATDLLLCFLAIDNNVAIDRVQAKLHDGILANSAAHLRFALGSSAVR
jgi:hypothetical protein